jgi:heterodisulfide reductase subunit A-like polyferredoxin
MNSVWPSSASLPATSSHCNPSQASQLMLTLGAGVAGLALAMGLHNKGISFTLYEEAKEYSVVG